MSRRSRRRPSRAKLKRNIPSFTVEVRRQPRRAANSTPNGRLFETAPVRSAFDRDTQRAADAVFESREPEQPLPDAGSAPPKGRILPSLVADDSATRSFSEDSAPEFESEQTPGAAKRRTTRSQKPAKPPKPRRTSVSSTIETAPLPASSATGSQFHAPPAEAIGVSQREPIAASGEPDGNAGVSRMKPKKQVKKPIPPERVRAPAPLAKAQPFVVANVPPTDPSHAGEVLPKLRKRTIMGRYVFGDELKPGERWKRLLQRKSR